MSVLVAESSITTSATPEAVWKLWSNVEGWPEWDPDVTSCVMTQEFQEGATAVLKPSCGPKVNLEIIECVPMNSFVTRSFLPCCTFLIFEHTMEKVGDDLKITHRVELEGFLAPIFNCLMGGSFRKGLPGALRNLASLAEEMK